MVLKLNSSANPENYPFFKKRLLESIGILIFVLSLVLFLSVLSFNNNDPSFTNLTNNTTQNIIGKYGAHSSDMLLNLFGAGSIIIFLIGFAWGAQLFFKKKINFLWIRLIFAPITIISCSIALNVITLSESWPLSTGVGGIIGKYSSFYLISFFQQFDYIISQTYISIFFSFITLVSLNLSMGFNQEDWSKFSNILFLILKKIFITISKIFSFAILYFKKFFLFFRPIITKIFGKFFKNSSNNSINNNNILDAELIREKNKNLKPGKLLKDSIEPRFKFEENDDFELPNLQLLNQNTKQSSFHNTNSELLKQNAKLLENVLKQFNIDAKIIGIHPGPVVTLYELEPAPGVKTSRIIGLTDDIARSMSAGSARISNVSGKNAVGIELPNQERETVYLKEIFGSKDFDSTSSKLPLVFGKNIAGNTVIQDLAKMPHLLIAGTTGSGKSVGLNAMILSLLYSLKPEQCKFIMIDPKMLELSVYDGIPHLLTPVVTNPKKAVVALKWVVREMEERYKKMAILSVRTMAEYNKKAEEYSSQDKTFKRRVHTGYDEKQDPIYEEEEVIAEKMPYIVVVIDEMADLMLVARNEIEHLVQRLAQMARAAGIHVIMATQRPSVDVVTGTIKANFPTRISFRVASMIDSRTILNEMGAEQLLGNGDMLFLSEGGRVTRVHGPFVSDSEVEKIVTHIRKQENPDYIDDIIEENVENTSDTNIESSGEDALFNQAVSIVRKDKRVSISYVQRRLQIGYNRAARIIEEMEERGIVSTPNNQGKRELLNDID